MDTKLWVILSLCLVERSMEDPCDFSCNCMPQVEIAGSCSNCVVFNHHCHKWYANRHDDQLQCCFTAIGIDTLTCAHPYVKAGCSCYHILGNTNSANYDEANTLCSNVNSGNLVVLETAAEIKTFSSWIEINAIADTNSSSQWEIDKLYWVSGKYEGAPLSWRDSTGRLYVNLEYPPASTSNCVMVKHTSGAGTGGFDEKLCSMKDATYSAVCEVDPE